MQVGRHTLFQSEKTTFKDHLFGQNGTYIKLQLNMLRWVARHNQHHCSYTNTQHQFYLRVYGMSCRLATSSNPFMLPCLIHLIWIINRNLKKSYLLYILSVLNKIACNRIQDKFNKYQSIGVKYYYCGSFGLWV